MRQAPGLGEAWDEAREILDALGQGLSALETHKADAHNAPEQINRLFRSAHTLKSLLALLGLEDPAKVAHRLEDQLDHIRMGQSPLSRQQMDGLFDGVDVIGRALGALEALEDKASGSVQIQAPAPAPPSPLDRPDGMRATLTRYEEHRLDENLRLGRHLAMVHATFSLMSFDRELATLEAQLTPLGEVIARLPGPPSIAPEKLAFDVLLAIQDDQALARLGNNELVRVEFLENLLPAGNATTLTRLPVATHAPIHVAPAQAPVIEPAAWPPAAAVGVQPMRSGPMAPTEAQAIVPATSAATEPLRQAAETATLVAPPDALSQTVRVDIRRLDKLMHLVGELTLSRMGLQALADGLSADPKQKMMAAQLRLESKALDRRVAQLRTSIMDTRLVPMSTLFSRLERAGRKVAREIGREVHIQMLGEQTELDKLIIEDLSEPLLHLVRNAIDHGIEPPDIRKKLGKPKEGFLRLKASTTGNHVQVEVTDDGAGIDADKVLQIARSKGLIDSNQHHLSGRDAFALLFLPGFSTRETISTVSGRGVGLDVVKTHIERLSGGIDIASNLGEGSTFTLIVPVTLAILPAILVVIAKANYAVPLANVKETLAIDAKMLGVIESRPTLRVRNEVLPLVDLSSSFGAPDGQQKKDVMGPNTKASKHGYALVVAIGNRRMALKVDQLTRQQDIVIKTLGRRLKHIKGIAGATELANRQTILVIDVVALLNEMGQKQRQVKET